MGKRPFKIGYSVVLNGSVDEVNPTLTVLDILPSELILVGWFDKDFQFHREVIYFDALTEIAGYNDHQDEDDPVNTADINLN